MCVAETKRLYLDLQETNDSTIQESFILELLDGVIQVTCRAGCALYTEGTVC